MKYDIHINKAAAPAAVGGDGQAACAHASPVPIARRFPPVVQVLTPFDATLEPQLSAVARQSYREGKALKEICGDLYRFARASGFDATIGVQEVYSTSMPSFRGQTVISALLMVDLRPLWTHGEAARGSLGQAG